MPYITAQLLTDFPDLQDLFPWAIEPWRSSQRPSLVTRESEADDDEVSADQSEEAHWDDGLTVQDGEDDSCDDPPFPVQWRDPAIIQTGKVIGIQGSISGLLSDLQSLDPQGNWTWDMASEAVSKVGVDSRARQMRRLDAGNSVGVDIVLAIARAFGLEPDDLAFSHVSPGKRRGKHDPIKQAELQKFRAQRDSEWEAALSNFELPLRALKEATEADRLATDLRSGRVEVKLEEPWRAGRHDNGRAPQLILDLDALICGGSSRHPIQARSLSGQLQETAEALLEQGLRVQVARWIGRKKASADDYQDIPGFEVRRAAIVVSEASEASGISTGRVNLIGDSRAPHSWRTDDLFELCATAVPDRKRLRKVIDSIRADIEWCGHWEGRWLPVWPRPTCQRLANLLDQAAAARRAQSFKLCP